jgi:hypothetical protein
MAPAGGGDSALSWTASCAATDTSYGVYEGATGSWCSHVARLCTTYRRAILRKRVRVDIDEGWRAPKGRVVLY